MVSWCRKFFEMLLQTPGQKGKRRSLAAVAQRRRLFQLAQAGTEFL